MNRLELKWHGPFSFSEIIKKEKESFDVSEGGGVYLWLYRVDNNDTIYYIGKSAGKPNNLYMRHFLHYMHFIGGLWNIPAGFPIGKSEWIPSPSPKINKDSEVMVSTIFDKKKFKEHVDRAFTFANQLSIYLSPVEPKNAISGVERNLLFDIKPMGTIQGTKTEPKNKILISHINAGWAFEKIKEKLEKKGHIFKS